MYCYQPSVINNPSKYETSKYEIFSVNITRSLNFLCGVHRVFESHMHIDVYLKKLLLFMALLNKIINSLERYIICSNGGDILHIRRTMFYDNQLNWICSFISTFSSPVQIILVSPATKGFWTLETVKQQQGFLMIHSWRHIDIDWLYVQRF